jgi:MarR family transcriptional regulator, transcriptional regulator for hemolysin
MAEIDADRSASNTGTPTAWVGESIGPQLNKSAKAARTMMEQRLAEAGATFGNWVVLATLEAGGSMIQRELAERLSIEGPTLTRHLERMEDRGLIRRVRSGPDRRAAEVILTDTGRELVLRLEVVARKANTRLLEGFSADEVEQLRSLLIRIHANSQP